MAEKTYSLDPTFVTGQSWLCRAYNAKGMYSESLAIAGKTLQMNFPPHSRIVSKIGAGGMGEVYRARDIRLDREVAIKILPASYTTDADRMKRFEQEARATSALNHPNILLGIQYSRISAGQ